MTFEEKLLNLKASLKAKQTNNNPHAYAHATAVNPVNSSPNPNPSADPLVKVLNHRGDSQTLIRQSFTLPPPLWSTPSNSPSPLILNPDFYVRLRPQKSTPSTSHSKLLSSTLKAYLQSLDRTSVSFHKSVCSWSQDFYKKNRLRRTESSRLARSVRDAVQKVKRTETKGKRNDEKIRMQHLKNNDIEEYKKMLEGKKGERLSYLIEKTDKYIKNISGLLEKQRSSPASASDPPSPSKSSKSNSKSSEYYSRAHSRTEEISQPTMLTGGNLKSYQLAGVEWLVSLHNNSLNGVLADEMGLGKTIQTIALLCHLMESKGNMGPYLIIVPLSTLSNWSNEFQRWSPKLKVITYRGPPQTRKTLYNSHLKLLSFNVLLTTYDFVIKDKSQLKKINYEYCIVDEGHRLKNANSKLAVTIQKDYNTKRRVLLTGTPLQNNLPELWALLNFLLPDVFKSVESFEEWFSKPFSETGGSQSLDMEERMLIINRLHEVLRPFMLRRLKRDVMNNLPQKTETVVKCQLSSWQREMYKSLTQSALGVKNRFMGGKSISLNNTLMQLRKVCNHPYLFYNEGWDIDDVMISCCGKFEILDKMLAKLRVGGHRVLIFTQMTQVITIMEDYLAYRGYDHLRLDGSTSAEEREKRMYRWNSPDSPDFVFLLSTRAGGLGLNLASADTVIIFDSDWNPTADAQASDRAHRIGQRQEVRIFRLVSKKSVEEKIVETANAKNAMNTLVVEAGKFDSAEVKDKETESLRQSMMKSLLEVPDKDEEEEDDEDEEDDEEDDEEEGGKFGVSKKAFKTLTSAEITLNEQMATSADEFLLYCSIDVERRAKKTEVPLYVDIADVPEDLRYHELAVEVAQPAERKKDKVSYDDGMTELQYMRKMERQFAEEEQEAKDRKDKKKKERGARSRSATPTRDRAATSSLQPPEAKKAKRTTK
ncbi:hypothetical protein TrST_g12559 [Triparma strigata]|uniref:Uncharacterized protein n=1 Tax=Triparma strigata TaxID=1606541 RepID=A0A9W7ELN1_9STRA|nr:hypothetical protein TrST_g12559 [Triparma strigata]